MPERRYGLCAVLIGEYIYPGWNLRARNGQLHPISGWRLVLHRILWGYTRLVLVPTEAAWSPFLPGALEGWVQLGALTSEGTDA